MNYSSGFALTNPDFFEGLISQNPISTSPKKTDLEIEINVLNCWQKSLNQPAMAQSLSKIYVHIIFHTKKSRAWIDREIEPELFSYIGGIIGSNDSIPLQINGTENHIHILAILSKNVAVSKLIEEIKRNSSRWIKGKGNQYNQFQWQKGYAVFSVSHSAVHQVKEYILNQKEHHKKMSFKEEYEKFLKIHEVDYNDQYLWE